MKVVVMDLASHQLVSDSEEPQRFVSPLQLHLHVDVEGYTYTVISMNAIV